MSKVTDEDVKAKKKAVREARRKVAAARGEQVSQARSTENDAKMARLTAEEDELSRQLASLTSGAVSEPEAVPTEAEPPPITGDSDALMGSKRRGTRSDTTGQEG